jgi:DNA-binding transcriptional MerR regulator
MNDHTMHIGELAERTSLSLRTLRHWDEVGLLQASGRTDGGFRLYTPADEQRALLIRSMKPLGFTLEEMTELLGAVDAAPEDPLGALDDERAAYFMAETVRRRDRLARHLAAAEDFLTRVTRPQA